MPKRKNNINRRNFLKTIAAAGAGSALFSGKLLAEQKDPNVADANVADPNAVKEPEIPPIPLRKFGKYDFKIPCFSLGVMFNALDQQAVLRKALQLGVYFWDCAHSYANGNAEQGIGKILETQPELRKKLFITSKAGGTPEEVEKCLQESMGRMNINYVDLYYMHGVRRADQLSDDMKKWVEEAKKRKLIKYFGFTTHASIECLLAASKLDWIDAIMTNYNYHLMQDAEMQEAIQVCHEKGIALIAMKTQARRVREQSDKEKELVEFFTKKGFAEGQAKVKAVLEDKRICSACVGVGRGNIEHLVLNVDAILDKRQLDEKDLAFLADFANRNCDGFCAGCENICSAAVPAMPYVAEVMRYLMYYNSYGDHEMARDLYAKLPAGAKRKMLAVDYSLAEACCPHHLPIGEIVAEAVTKLA